MTFAEYVARLQEELDACPHFADRSIGFNINKAAGTTVTGTLVSVMLFGSAPEVIIATTLK